MNGKDLLIDLGNISHKYYEEAETDVQLKDGRISRKKLVLISLAATMLLATLTGAAVFTRWSRTAQTRYNPSEDVKEQAEKSGLSVMLEDTKDAENPKEVLSVNDQGITITAVQSIVDNYHAELIFRIEGFELPEGQLPHVWPVVSIDGEKHLVEDRPAGSMMA